MSPCGCFFRFPGSGNRKPDTREDRSNFLALDELARLWGAAPFAALDFETTGLDSVTDRICEIGAVRLAPSGMEEATFSLLVNPGRPMNPSASRVNGITDDMVACARPVGEVLPELLEFLGDSIIVAHNAAFDVGFLRAEAARTGVFEFGNRVADTKRLAKDAFPGLPSYSLQNLAKSFGLDPGNAHRACDDARTCARLLALCAQVARSKAGLPDASAPKERERP